MALLLLATSMLSRLSRVIFKIPIYVLIPVTFG
jgi:hypothetical protein